MGRGRPLPPEETERRVALAACTGLSRGDQADVLGLSRRAWQQWLSDAWETGILPEAERRFNPIPEKGRTAPLPEVVRAAPPPEAQARRVGPETNGRRAVALAAETLRVRGAPATTDELVETLVAGGLRISPVRLSRLLTDEAERAGSIAWGEVRGDVPTWVATCDACGQSIRS